MPSPVASLRINKDRSLRVGQAQSVRADWRLLKFICRSFTVACIWSPCFVSVSEPCSSLRWFLTSPAVHPVALQRQLTERCVPSTLALPVCGHCAWHGLRWDRRWWLPAVLSGVTPSWGAEGQQRHRALPELIHWSLSWQFEGFFKI